MKIFLTIILLSVLAYIFLLVILFAFQSRLVYFPLKEIASDPKSIGIKYEPISFVSSDGVKLFGWFIPSDKGRGVILFNHGNAGNISHRLDSIRIFNSIGFSIFIYDYRGYGNSEGSPSEKGTYRDAESAWRYLTKEMGIDPSKIIIFGRSLGGSIAAWLSQKHTPGALILESTFTSIKDLAKKYYPFLPVRFISRFDYNTQIYVKNVYCPSLIIHSKNDDIVPFSHSLKLFKSANEPKNFLEIEGSHNEGFMISGDRYVNGLNIFLTRYYK